MKTHLMLGGKHGQASRQLYLERPGVRPHESARTLLRWLSGHKRQRVWVIGTRKWSVLILKDDDAAQGEPELSALEAYRRVRDGLA